MNTTEHKPIFHEVQRFRQVWLWVLLIGSTLSVMGIFGYGMYQQLYLNRPFGDQPMSNTTLILVSVLAVGAVGASLAGFILFYIMELRVTVNEKVLVIRFFPFIRRTIPLEDILKQEVYSENAMRCGIEYSLGRGWRYSAGGGHGVQLELAGGKKIAIGTQRPQELEHSIRKAKMNKRTEA